MPEVPVLVADPHPPNWGKTDAKTSFQEKKRKQQLFFQRFCFCTETSKRACSHSLAEHSSRAVAPALTRRPRRARDLTRAKWHQQPRKTQLYFSKKINR
jgi:hypothetical protein